MNIEENRLQTFNEWPSDAAVSAARIAKAGFYYTREDLTVECFCCRVRISDWNYGDQVMARHKQLSPQCAFVLNPPTSENVPSISASNSSESLPSDDLKNEQVRLRTFENWQFSHIVLPQRLAEAGFYYLKQRDLTKCAFCNGIVGAWQAQDVPDLEHQRHFPRCSFVQTEILPRTIGIEQTKDGQNNTDALKNEQVRLSTFGSWPKSDVISPQLLVKAGFYYTGESDATKCAFCSGEAVNWTQGDNPELEHKRLFPYCVYVLNVINPRLSNVETVLNTDTFQNFNAVSTNNLQELGVQTFESPKKPNLCSVESRLRTFIQWPDDLIQTPDILSQAGFYYGGAGDLVRCFHCDGGLQHWDPADDPWVEHAKWFPNCSFVKLVKGQEFINTQLQLMKDRNKTPITREVAEQFLPAYMQSPIVIQALNIGLNVGRIRQAVLEKLHKTGSFFCSPDALIEATLNIQYDEDDMQDADNSVSQEVSQILTNFVEQCSNGDERKSNASEGRDTTSGNGVTVSLEEENRILKEARLCKICMDHEVGIVFLPCGHLTVCVNCAPNLKDCPVCRSAIKATVRTFLS